MLLILFLKPFVKCSFEVFFSEIRKYETVHFWTRQIIYIPFRNHSYFISKGELWVCHNIPVAKELSNEWKTHVLASKKKVGSSFEKIMTKFFKIRQQHKFMTYKYCMYNVKWYDKQFRLFSDIWSKVNSIEETLTTLVSISSDLKEYYYIKYIIFKRFKQFCENTEDIWTEYNLLSKQFCCFWRLSKQKMAENSRKDFIGQQKRCLMSFNNRWVMPLNYTSELLDISAFL